MKKIALINQKGGVGKTTSTINIGAGLSMLGKKVLLIDLDPQSNLTYSLGIQVHELESGVFDLLKEREKFEEIVIDRDGLMVIPSSLELSGAEVELASEVGREFLMREALESLNGFDYVLIDCSPSLGLLTVNALVAAEIAYIPLQTEFLALQGLSQLLRTIEVVKKRLNRDLEIGGIIATRYNRRRLNKEVIEKIREYFEDKVFNTLIRENISLAEAPSFGKTIYEYKPNSHGAEDYMSLCKEIIERS
jgi:chromosome partitioning protein